MIESLVENFSGVLRLDEVLRGATITLTARPIVIDVIANSYYAQPFKAWWHVACACTIVNITEPVQWMLVSYQQALEAGRTTGVINGSKALRL